MSACARRWVAGAVVVWLAMAGGYAQPQDVAPVNSGANPYRVIRDWARLTLEQRPWGGSNGVAIDRDGRSVWATDRCSAGITPGLAEGHSYRESEGRQGDDLHAAAQDRVPGRGHGEGIAIDAAGNLFTAEATVRGVTKYVKE